MNVPGKGGLDDIDLRLLALLRDDARQTIAQLAKDLGISRALVYSRLARLEEQQVVAGYTVRLGHSFSASRVRAHTVIKVHPKFRQVVEDGLAALPQVQAIHAITGEYDVIAVLEAENGAQLNQLIDAIGQFEGIERTMTAVILATKLER